MPGLGKALSTTMKIGLRAGGLRKRGQKSSMSSWPHHLPSGNQKRFLAPILRFFEVARVLVRFAHVATIIEEQ
jgi:hypothetical protein